MTTMFDRINKEEIEASLKEDKFPFSKYLFWDYKIESIDLIKNKRYVIERVLTRGDIKDLFILLKLYDKKSISSVVIKSRVLDLKTINFWRNYYKLKENNVNPPSFYN